jgi:hypothetical protein
LRSRFRCSANAVRVMDDEMVVDTIDLIAVHASSKSLCKHETRVHDSVILYHRRRVPVKGKVLSPLLKRVSVAFPQDLFVVNNELEPGVSSAG